MSNLIKHKVKVLIVALTILFLVGCDNVTKEPEVSAEVIRPAKIYTVSEQSQLNYLSLPAVIEAKDSIALAFEISGKIQKVYVESGQDVKKGDMIAKLDQTSLKNDLAAIKANYDNVRVRFNRVKKLIKNNTISRSMFEQTESEYKIAQANYNNAKQRLADSVIYSPYTGPVSRVHVDNFETIVPDQAIVTIQQDGASLAVASVPSSIIANSKKFKPTSIKVLMDSAPNLQMEGVVESFETMTESSSQSFPVKIQFTPPENLTVLPGMTATIEISYQDSDKATDILIPLTAVISEAGKTYVWLVNDDMTVSKKAITLDDQAANASLIVLDGLENNQRIISAGAAYMHEGMKIREYNAK